MENIDAKQSHINVFLQINNISQINLEAGLKTVS
mgnify:CR=1 FL=1